MLTLKSINLNQARDYFEKSDNSYYLQESAEYIDFFGGAGNSLSGKQITKENYKMWLLANILDEKYAGFDLAFSAPKSLSLLLATTNDIELRKKIIKLQQQAVTLTMNKYVASSLKYRKYYRKNKKMGYVLDSGEGIEWASFVHQSSRIAKNSDLEDPQLHIHIFIKNLICDKNGKYHKIDAFELYNNKKIFGKLYRIELFNLLQQQGIKLKITDYKNFFFELDIENLTKSDLDMFSQRTAEINEALKEVSTENKSKAKEAYNKKNKRSKDTSKKIEDLRQEWQAKLGKTLELQTENKTLATTEDINKSIEKSKLKLTENKAHFNRYELFSSIKQDLIINNFQFKNDDIDKQIQEQIKSKEIIKKLNIYTTKKQQIIENSILKFALETKNSQNKLSLNALSDIENWENKNFKLTDSQKTALYSILNSQNSLCVIEGNAGSGKTAMLKALKEITNSNNINFIGSSITAAAASEIQSASDISSFTTRSFIMKKNKDIANQIFIVDEASMLSSEDMLAITKKCKESNARLLLVGDDKQLASINSGGMFTYLQRNENITFSYMEESIRQKSEHSKEVIKLLQTKEKSNVNKALDLLKSNNSLEEIKDKSESLNKIANDYINDKTASKFIIAQRNSDMFTINDIVREKLKEAGKIDKNEVLIENYIVKNESRYDKSYHYVYEKNDIVEVGLNGQYLYDVKDVDKENNLLTLQRTYDKKIINRLINNKDNIYFKKEQNYAVGDEIVFLKNNKAIGVDNSDKAIIKNIKENNEAGGYDITVELLNKKEKKEITFNSNFYKFFGHGYAVSNYKSQGKTTEDIFVYLQGNETYNDIYVATSRAKENIKMITNSEELLYKNSSVDKRQLSAKEKFERENYFNEIKKDEKEIINENKEQEIKNENKEILNKVFESENEIKEIKFENKKIKSFNVIAELKNTSKLINENKKEIIKPAQENNKIDLISNIKNDLNNTSKRKLNNLNNKLKEEQINYYLNNLNM